MKFEHTRLFIARRPPSAPAAVSDADEPTRFLAMESRASRLTEGIAPVEHAAATVELDDTDPTFLRASWAGRARGAWRALSIPTRVALVLLPIAALLVLDSPRLPSGALASDRAAPPARSTRTRPAPSGTAAVPAAQAPPADALAAPARAGSTPRAAADAVAGGRCAEAVTRYRELSRLRPEVEAYREAARILQEQPKGCSGDGR